MVITADHTTVHAVTPKDSPGGHKMWRQMTVTRRSMDPSRPRLMCVSVFITNDEKSKRKIKPVISRKRLTAKGLKRNILVQE